MVLLCIANYADQFGNCRFSQQKIAEETEQSINTVRKNLAHLERIGLIKRTKNSSTNGRLPDVIALQAIPKPCTSNSLKNKQNANRGGCAEPENVDKSLKNKQNANRGGSYIDSESFLLESSLLSNPSSSESENQKSRSIHQSVARSRSPTTRGTRLSPDWRPSEENIRYANGEGFAYAEVMKIAERFRDYWIARAGGGAAKLDWDATWRNWIRTTLDNQAKPKRRHQDDDTMLDLMRQINESDEREARGGYFNGVTIEH